MTAHEKLWAEIRRCYEQTDEPRARIADRLGVTDSAIKSRIKSQGWTARPSPKRKTKKKKPAAKKCPRSRTATIAPLVISPAVEILPPLLPKREGPDTSEYRTKRLFSLIDLQLDHLEALMNSGELEAEDEVRKSRLMQNVISNLEKVTDIANGKQSRRGHAALDPAERANRAEQLRREIAERLERLNAQWCPSSAEKKEKTPVILTT